MNKKTVRSNSLTMTHNVSKNEKMKKRQKIKSFESVNGKIKCRNSVKNFVGFPTFFIC